MPENTSTVASQAKLSYQCLDIASSLSKNLASNGTIILESQELNDPNLLKPETYLMNIESGETTPLSLQGERLLDVTVSPNKKHFAFESVLHDRQNTILRDDLVISVSDGNRLKTIPWMKNWTNILGWLDNEHLLISVPDPKGTQLLINPFNAEQEFLRPDFLNLANTGKFRLPFWDGQDGIVYDPTLTRAVFTPILANTPNKKDEKVTFAIWDLSQQKLVANLDKLIAVYANLNIPLSIPRWNQDGSAFVFQTRVDPNGPYLAGETSLFQISRDGQVIQMLHLGHDFEIAENSYHWSPDGRYVAMILTHGDSLSAQKGDIAVVDTQTMYLTNYCISINWAGRGYFGQPPVPIWSPDGKQFLVSDRDEAGHWRVILVDIEKNTAVQIATDMEAVGWMTNEP